MRNPHLDALRGYCLLVVCIDHLRIYGLSHLTRGTFGFFDAAEGFIFISGLVAGSYYSRLAVRSSLAVAGKRAVLRSWDVYLTHVFIFALVLGVGVLLLPRDAIVAHHAEVVGSYGWIQAPHPLATLLLGGLLLFQPDLLCILPFYALVLLWVPLLIWAWKAGRQIWAVAASGSIWLLSQPGVIGIPNLPISPHFNRFNFNFFSWQFLFVCAFMLGCIPPSQKTDRWLASLRATAVVLAIWAFLFVVRHNWSSVGLAIPFFHSWWRTWWAAKQTLGPVRIFDFGLFAFLLAQVLMKYGSKVVATRLYRYLSYLGQHSLQVYAWSILVCYTVAYSRRIRPMSSRNAEMVLDLIGVASLVIPAWLHSAYRERAAVWSNKPYEASTQEFSGSQVPSG